MQELVVSGMRRPASARVALELDKDHVHGLIANVLRGMGQRIAKNNVASLKRALRDFAICGVVPIPAAFQDVNDVGGMRMHLLLDTGWQDSFEDTDTIIFELHAYRFGIDDGRVLRVPRCDRYADE